MDSELSRIEAQLDAYAALVAAADSDAEINDHIVVDRSTWTLTSRLNATEHMILCSLNEHDFVKGWVVGLGEDHVELSTEPDAAMVHAIVRPSACMSLTSIASASRELPAISRSFNGALRHIILENVQVRIITRSGPAISGQIAYVQKDHLDVRTGSASVLVPSANIIAIIVVG